MRRLFALETKSLHKLAFFLVVLVSATVNVRLAALLPWKQSGEERIRSTGGRAKVLWRARVLRNILWLHMMHKLIEDLPQLVLAALFLGTQSGTQSDAEGAAVLQLVVSGVSLGLTIIWLGLQGADSCVGEAAPPEGRMTTAPRYTRETTHPMRGTDVSVSKSPHGTDVEPSTSRVQFSEVSITLGGVHRLSEESKERLPALPDDVDELSTTPRKTSTMV